MARVTVFTSGFEVVPVLGVVATPDGLQALTNGVTVETSFARTGSRCLKLEFQAGQGQARWMLSSAAGVGFGNTVSFPKTFGFALRVPSGTPSERRNIAMVMYSASVIIALHLETNRSLTLRDSSGIQIGGASGALTADQWYWVEIRHSHNAATNTRDVAFAVDGTQVASGTAVSTNFSNIQNFYLESLSAGDVPIYFDDLILQYDDTAEGAGFWIGDTKVALLTPQSDVQDGTWTIASGGNTNLYDAANNLPVQNTSPSAASDGNRIESVDSSGDNSTDEARFGLTTYTDAGVGANDTVLALAPFVMAGEEAGTGTKSISYGFYSNPAGSLNTVFDVTQGDSGAVGTYSGDGATDGWWWFYPGNSGGIIDSPTVTKGSAPVLNLRKTDTGTRSATVGFIGAYVAYQVAAVATKAPIYTRHFNQALLSM